MAYTRRQTPQELAYDDVRAWVRFKGARIMKRVLNAALGDITDEFKTAALENEFLEPGDFNDPDIERRFLRAVQHRFHELEEARRALPAKK